MSHRESFPGTGRPCVPGGFSATSAVRLLAISGLLLCRAARGDTPPRLYDIAPVPAWVEERALDPKATAAPAAGAAVDYVLVDQQIRVDATTERYERRVKRLLSSAGVQSDSELRFDFEPTYERLRLHHVRIQRGAKTIDALAASEIKVIQQETALEEKIYNGNLTAVLFLKDVRPGDVVDEAYSVEGVNPVLQGHFATHLQVGSSRRVAELHHRLLWPASRPIYFKDHGSTLSPVEKASGAQRVFSWEKRDLPALEHEDRLPVWYEPVPWIEVSDFRTWGEVAVWASALFHVEPGAAAAFDELARDWERLPDEQARALAAVRFVQDGVRYLGMEIGPNTHRPHPPAQVLEQRFGDCKDKALLLVTLLRRLGVPAVPALVNTRARTTLDAWQPSPYAFDHAIVRLRVGGRDVFIDATQSNQGGDLLHAAQPPYARALLVDPSTTALVPIEVPPLSAPNRIEEETYELAKGSAAELVVKTVSLGSEADDLRGELAATSQAALAKQYLNFYAEIDPGISILAPLSVEDDRAKNTITVVEKYRIPEFWTHDDTRRVNAGTIDTYLGKPHTTLRSLPLGLSHPVHIQRRVVFQLHGQGRVTASALDIDTPAFRFRMHVEDAGTVVEETYETRRDAVMVSDLAKHFQACDAAREALWFRVRRVSSFRDADTRIIFGLGGLIVLIAIPFGVRSALLALRRRRFARLGKVRPGETPASALAISDDDELVRKLLELRCTCGARAGDRDLTRQSLVFNERPMIAATRTCPWCRTEQTFYFARENRSA